jgi:hypothetical protein
MNFSTMMTEFFVRMERSFCRFLADFLGRAAFINKLQKARAWTQGAQDKP